MPSAWRSACGACGPSRVTEREWDSARALVLRHGWNAASYQILNPGMRLWFSAAGDAVAGYGVHGRVRVVAGAPVCAPERLRSAAGELEADAAAHGQRVVFFGAGMRLERAYAASPSHAMVDLGAQPVWDPHDWIGIVARRSSLRAQLHRAANKDVRVERWPVQQARASEAIHGVLHDWLASRGLPPLRFMVTPGVLERGDDRRVFVARRGDDGPVVAYLVATPVPARDGWLVEQWPRSPEAPNGTTHLLVDAAMRSFAADGSRYVTLGLAPLSDRGAGDFTQPAWLRVLLHWLRAHGRRFYNFEGLEAFKAGMQPAAWEPIFAIAQGRRFSPVMLHAIAGVFSGGSPEALVARALLHAARDEARRGWRGIGRPTTS